MATRSCNSTTARRSASPSSLVVRLEETGELLEQTCGEISDATTTELIEVANSVAAQRKMQDLLPVYFHSWQLQSPESIMVFLLLSYFVLNRECTGLKQDRQSFEDHIESLKTRVGELEQELSAVSATTNKSVHSDGEFKELQHQNTKLQKAQDELYQINQQWALDYESLTRRIVSNTTSCHSISSSGSTNTSMCTHSQNLQQQLEESHRQICELTARNDTLEQERVRSDRMARILENENRAIQIQLQELGDLQMALKLKEEHIKLEYQFAQLKREHQDLISERLQLHKQLEKVRHAFLHIFPFVSTTSIPGRERSSTHGGGGGYNTVPKLACRRQHYYLDPTPPTPPGLIARGITHQGSLVEKDLKPRIHYDEQVTGFERSHDEPHTWPCATDTIPKKKTRPNSIFHLDQLKCPSCSKAFSFAREDFDRWFEHIKYCGV